MGEYQCIAAEWALVAEQDLSSAFIRMVSPKGKRWTADLMVNYKYQQTIKQKFYSTIDQIEVDCTKGQIRILQMANYSSQMGGGYITFESSVPTEWKIAEEGTVKAELVRTGCEKIDQWTWNRSLPELHMNISLDRRGN